MGGFTNPIITRSTSQIREGNRNRSTRDSDSVPRWWSKINALIFTVSQLAKSQEALQMQVAKMRRRIVGGGGNMTGWHKPSSSLYEVDSTFSYDEGSVIHIQPTHALVTTGIRDAANPSGGLVKSKSGMWVAIRDVPPQTTVSGNPVWNLPQWPMPNLLNYDDPLNFWLFLGDICS